MSVKKQEKKIEYLSDYNGRKKTRVIWDRTRTVNYNGNEIHMNIYSCSSCKEGYRFEEVQHYFCPFCGTKYKFATDVSI